MSIEIVRAWVSAAVADGWNAKQTYDHEPIVRAVTLTKSGWTAMCLMRPAGSGPNDPIKDRAMISLWAPDSLSVDAPEIYSMATLEEGARRCQFCHELGNTVRIGFAGRCCPSCRKEHVATVEYPGWCD